MHDRRVKLYLGAYGRGRSENRRYIDAYGSGASLDEIAESLPFDDLSKEDRLLVAEYMVGKKSDWDIRHLITPYKPTSISLESVDSEGFVYATDNGIKMLVRPEGLTEEKARKLAEDYPEEMCYLAYKRAHEGNPAQLGDGSMVRAVTNLMQIRQELDI